MILPISWSMLSPQSYEVSKKKSSKNLFQNSMSSCHTFPVGPYDEFLNYCPSEYSHILLNPFTCVYCIVKVYLKSNLFFHNSFN